MNNPFDRIAEPNQYIAWSAGWESGCLDEQKNATRSIFKSEVDKDESAQRLLEQFILFLQDAGYRSAVMTLDQMEGLREKVDAVSSTLANIEVYR